MHAAFCTVFARNYTSQVRVLARSLRTHAAGVPLTALLIDEPRPPFDPAAEVFRIVRLDDIGVPGLRQACFRLNLRELASMVKPFLLAHLLDQGFRSVVFLDPDILAVGPMEPVLERVRLHAVTLTPHFVRPPHECARGIERELRMLLVGTLNAGFVGLTDGDDARTFLQWWQDRVAGDCAHRTGDGVFYDQRWLDLAPGLFADVHIARDPGWNVAYWNLPERVVRSTAHGLTVDGVAARFFHFSGFRPGDRQLSRYADHVSPDETGDAERVYNEYEQRLLDADHCGTRWWPYAFDTFDNGVRIAPAVRRMYRELGSRADAFGDPFSTAPSNSFFRWLRSPAPGSPAISRFWRRVYESRPDLQAAFPDLRTGDDFRGWTRAFGRTELEVDDAFLL
jgi:hypothetical protein